MRKKKPLLCAALFLACALMCTAGLAEVPAEYAASRLQRQVYMPDGSGPFQYYAQNDPVWQRTIYEPMESDTQRVFGDGGCNPTSLAMVVASLVPVERLNLLGLIAARGRTFTLCSCSVNKYFCFQHRKDPDHVQSTLITGQDFLKVLPLALADYATGNNPTYDRYRLPGTRSGGNGGTSKNLFEPIAALFALDYQLTQEFDQVLSTLNRGGMAIALCSGNTQIFSGSNGHYVVLCAYDDEYLYIMDPFVRDGYKKDRQKIIEPVEDGVKKVKLENLSRCGFGNYALFVPAPTPYYAGIQPLVNPYTTDSAEAFASAPHGQANWSN